jgi:hypothetical protein
MTKLCKHLTDTYEIIDDRKIHDFNRCLAYLDYQGKAHYGPTFRINSLDLPVIYRLVVYMLRDEKAALAAKLDLNKGLLVTGPIGCGKTSLMHLVKAFAPPPAFYKIKTCREISLEFAKYGYEPLSRYTQKQAQQSRLPGYCFDDLGAEHQIKHYGNECNVMAEVLLSRYEQFVENQTVTHLTTNLSASEIELFYGNRLRSRMRQMFNLISFDKNSHDKR